MFRTSMGGWARHERQTAIPSIGQKGQIKLKNSKVFVAGPGGLGLNSSYYLTAAGIGHLTIVDGDIVGITDLNRQIIHKTDR